MTEAHLYRHFDANGDLLYVGTSLSAVKRLGQHKYNSVWFSQIARVDIEMFESRNLALQAEEIAIKSEFPLYNVIYARQPLSEPDPDREAKILKMIEDAYDGVEYAVDGLEFFGEKKMDILRNMALITIRGASIKNLFNGRVYSGRMLGEAVLDSLAADARLKRDRIDKAREVLKSRKVKTGPSPKLEGPAKIAARQDYDDVSQPIRAVAKKHGVSPSTLRRMFGERGTPRGRRRKQEVSS